ncbi:tetratricopeptide repeat protein [Alloprevotella tannerae]|uniref:tetratricopeptide repeat protein n=1 Tax=Alloprevotella tannerae TaxID=76122 RepID=UPI0028EE5468|nr:tetratricopeptide repeat protein [Alloprevotella tannerae]
MAERRILSLASSSLKRYLGTYLFFLFSTFSIAQINIENVVEMGRYALSYDDYLSAIHYFNSVLDVRPKHAQAYYYRAYAKFSLGDFSGAENDCTASIRLNPYLTETYRLRGLCRIRKSEFQGAITDYEQVLKDFPSDEGALFNQGLCYLQVHKTDSATIAADRLLKQSPKFYRGYMLKAQIAFEQKDTINGLQQIDALLTLHPSEASAWMLKAQYALQKGKYQLADSLLTTVIRYEKNNYEPFLLRAEARHALNQFGNALLDYDKVIELVPKHFVAHYNRALLRALVGDDNRAIDDFNFVLSVEPDNTLARYNRALLREQTGDYQGAIKDYSILIKAYPNFLFGYYARSRLRRKTGNTRGALADETVVARAQLDIAFAKPKRSFIRTVRKRSDHALEHYDRPIEDETDTVRILGDLLLGHVENQTATQEILPAFTPQLQTTTTRGYRSDGYLDELSALSKRIADIELQAERAAGNRYLQQSSRRLLFTAEKTPETTATLTQHLQIIDSLQSAGGELSQYDYKILRTILLRAIYNFSEALQLASSIIASDSTLALPYVNRAAILIGRSKAEKTTEKITENTQSPHLSTLYLNQALEDINVAISKLPDCAYLYYNRSCIYHALHNQQAALTDLDQAIALDHRLAEAYYNRAVIRLQNKETENVTADLSRAGELGLYKAYSLLKQTQTKKTKHKVKRK